MFLDGFFNVMMDHQTKKVGMLTTHFDKMPTQNYQKRISLLEEKLH